MLYLIYIFHIYYLVCLIKYLIIIEPQEGVKISLEGSQVAFISSDRLVISLKSGELYVLSLFADSMRSVRGFHFDKAAASVLTSCVSIVNFSQCIYKNIFIK